MKFTKERYEQLDKQLRQAIAHKLTIREISESLHISRSAVERRLKTLGLSVPNYHNALKFDNTVFDCIDSEEKAYWLGFLYADGYISSSKNIVSVALQSADTKHLEKLKIFLNTSACIKNKTVKSKNKTYYTCSLQVCDKHFKQRLVELGCVPKKSLILQFPNLSIFTNPELVYHFVRGYVDGDGCLTFSKKGRLEVSILGTEQFLTGIQQVFPGRFKSIHHIKRTKSDICKISNTGENADFVATVLYQNAHIYLQRKFDRFAVLCRKR